MGRKGGTDGRYLQDTWVPVLTHMFSYAHNKCTHLGSSSPQHGGLLQRPALSSAQARVWGGGPGPGPDAPYPGPVPSDLFPSLGKLFNLGTELLLHCPLGFGPWWGKGAEAGTPSPASSAPLRPCPARSRPRDSAEGHCVAQGRPGDGGAHAGGGGGFQGGCDPTQSRLPSGPPQYPS